MAELKFNFSSFGEKTEGETFDAFCVRSLQQINFREVLNIKNFDEIEKKTILNFRNNLNELVNVKFVSSLIITHFALNGDEYLNFLSFDRTSSEQNQILRNVFELLLYTRFNDITKKKDLSHCLSSHLLKIVMDKLNGLLKSFT